MMSRPRFVTVSIDGDSVRASYGRSPKKIAVAVNSGLVSPLNSTLRPHLHNIA